MELVSYIYWQLESTDLIAYQGKSNDEKELSKKMLYGLVASLPPCKIKDDLEALAEFGMNHRISIQCLLYIKYKFSDIADIVGREEIINIWSLFMHREGIHHFRCRHTMREIENNLKVLKEKIQTRAQVHCQNLLHQESGVRITPSDMLIIYKHFPQVYNCTKNEVALIQEHTGGIVAYFCRLFALNCIDSGKLGSEATKIYKFHVDRFFAKIGHLMSNNTGNFVFGDINPKSTIKYIVNTINEYLPRDTRIRDGTVEIIPLGKIDMKKESEFLIFLFL